MNQEIEAQKAALSALESLQDFTKNDYPKGLVVHSRRGRGLAKFTIVGYPDPVSVDSANSVIGESQKGKNQVISLASITGTES